MIIQKTVLPAPVEDLFSFHESPFSAERAAEATALFGEGLWKWVALTSRVPWPFIEGATISAGQAEDGVLFVLETDSSLLAIGAVGDGTGRESWHNLTSTVADLKEQMFKILREGEVSVSTIQLPAVPSEPTKGSWIVVVPLAGMRYYKPSEEAILTSLTAFGQYVLSERVLWPADKMAS